MARWGMVIDLDRCVGCYACVMACKTENGTPRGVFWTAVLERETGVFPSTRRTFLPVLCNHCEEPACLEVCPTGATYKREDGIVLIDADKCMGCRYCMMACPYNVRVFMDRVQGYFPAGLTPYERVRYETWQEGTVTKCTFCVRRVDQGLDPMCVVTCPTSARVFGDLDSPDSRVARLLRERGGSPLRPEAGTGPSVYYLGTR